MNDNRFMSSSNAQASQIDLGLRTYMLGVYNHMTTALALTGLMAMGLNFLAISNGALTPIGELFFLSPLKWVLMLAPLGMVFYLSAKLNSISAEKARNLFYVYAGLMGLSLSSLLLVYTGASVVRAFFVTAAAFAALSIYGYTTKKSLSGLGSFLMMGVFGLIIAQIVNIFMAINILTICAIIRPKTPIIKNEPRPDNDFFVVYPYIDKAANAAAVTKKALTTDAPVYTSSNEESDNPINPA